MTRASKLTPRTTKARRQVPSEALECQRLVDYLKMRGIKHSHVPNEATSRAQRIKNARLGTVAGLPDYLILLPGRQDILFIEMKRQIGGRVSVEQKDWTEALRAQGQQAFVCKGFSEAKAVIQELLGESVGV